MLHAVIMAGGSGTRFWPVSRSTQPKQLLNLLGDRTMIQATSARLGDLVPPDRQIIVTNQSLVQPIAQQLPDLPAGSIVGEPCRRDTAPCVGLAAAMVRHADQDATMVVMPADHVILSESKFRDAVQTAAQLVDEQADRIVTFGIRPTYPAESFGYIERGPSLTEESRPNRVFQVRTFHEKPTLPIAKQYFDSGDFYWNSGIFVWKAQTVLDALGRFEPQMAEHLSRIGHAIGRDNFAETLDREFSAIEGKSIDYAIMEHYEDVVMIQADFDWDDLGSWQSLARLRGADADGNTIVGKHLGLQTRGCTIRTSEDHLVVTVGMEDCIVVHTGDATLVMRKEHEELIRDVVGSIKEREWHHYL